MEGERGSAAKLSRLRLVLPDLSHSLVGNWLASVDKLIPPELRYDYDDFLDPSEVARKNVDRSKQTRRGDRKQSKWSGPKHAYSNQDKREGSIAANSPALWLRVGEMPPCDPVLRTWELCHQLEKISSEKTVKDISDKVSPHPPIYKPSFRSTVEHRPPVTAEKSPPASPRDQATFLPESELVRDALYALQGVHAAVRNLEKLSKIYSTTPADKCTQNMCTLWTRSVTASALGKILAVIARAGYVRCQLDAFVSFFLDDPLNPFGYEGETHSQLSRRARRRMRKRRQPGAKDFGEYVRSTTKSKNEIPRHCLVNQAFAGAVKGILRGHSAALNTLAASVAFRRGHESLHASEPLDLLEHDPGPVIGYEELDISLLEFYLHTRELRVQLHSLAFVCLMREGKHFVGRNVSDFFLQDNSATRIARDQSAGMGKKNDAVNDQCNQLAMSFESFPRGADLLTYLYDQLMDLDPLHMELFRFLFERTYEPYSVFIQSWLYQASVRDPYGEFIIEEAEFCGASLTAAEKGQAMFDQSQMSLKLRSGLYVPSFMESICTPLIRAGEQLRVLLRLPETCELAQQMAKNMRTWELFLPQNRALRVLRSGSCTTVLPALVFSKRKLDEIAKQREKKSQDLCEQFDMLFNKLASRRSKCKTSGHDIESDASSRVSVDLNVPDNGHKGRLVADTAVDQQSSPSDASKRLGNLELIKKKPHSGYKVTLPARGWLTSPESLSTSEEKTSSVKGRGPFVAKSFNDDRVFDLKCMEMNVADFSCAADEACFHLGPMGSKSLVAGGDEMPEGHSFISDHQRGTSWPLWGLPLNPFLVQSEREDAAPNTYVHPSFVGTYRHWDVTAKPTGKTLSAGVAPRLYMASVEPSRQWTEKSFEPQWFGSLELTLNQQLFAGLDAHLNFPTWGKADVTFSDLENDENEVAVYFNQSSLDVDETVTDPQSFFNVPFVESGLHENFVSPKHLDKSGVQFADVTDISASVADLVLSRDQIEPPNLHSRADCLEKTTLPLWSQFPGNLLHETSERSGGSERDLFLSSTDDINRNDSEELLDPFDEAESGLELRARDTKELKLDSRLLDEDWVQGPASWEQYLKSSDPLSPDAAMGINGNEISEIELCADEEIPLSVVVSTCIAEEILFQYQSISTVTVRLFQEGLGLQDHYMALRRYFFMERGDWAEYFITALCQHKWGHLGGESRQMEVQEMLEAALQKSSCEGDEYAERVQACFIETTRSFDNLTHKSTWTPVSCLVDCSRIDAFDFISLEYRVDWPLNLILTRQSFRLYNIVFTFLMRVKLTVLALDDIWQRLQVIDRSLRKERGSALFLQQKNRFRTLQQFRQQICHFVMAVQRHLESKLLNVVWSKFVEDVQREVNDLQDLEIVHRKYLENAIEECFLSAKTSSVKGCIDSVMQCVLDFSLHMKSSFYRSGDKLQVIDDGLFMQVHQIKKGFQASLLLLHGYQTQQDPQSRSNLADLWMVLDYNSFLTRALSTEHL